MKIFACTAIFVAGLAVGVALGALVRVPSAAPESPRPTEAPAKVPAEVPAEAPVKAPVKARLCRFGERDVYDGKVVGLYRPLVVEETPEAFTVAGETFRYAISRGNGQMVSAKVLGQEYLAEGTCLPDPYVGLFPEDDPGASPLGNARTALYGFEKASRIKPPMHSEELTNAFVRADARGSVGVEVTVTESGPGGARITAEGTYAGPEGPLGVSWRVTYDFDVDGFARIDVEAFAEKPVMLQWHCFLHARLRSEACEFFVPWTDEVMSGITGFRALPPVFVEDRKAGELLFAAKVNPYLHFGNARTGMDFSRERFDGRMSGYRDSSVRFADGFRNRFDAALGPDGTWVGGSDSRGRRWHMTQVYLREDFVELEDFDVRNTTLAFNPGDSRHRYLFLQLSPPKLPRPELNAVRVVWPGPHQIVMAGWSRSREWSPPGQERVARWKELGVNLIVGGFHDFDGDAASATKQDEVREFLRYAHDAGMKVIPYVTFSDFEFAARDYRTRMADWHASACIEFKNETTLMCFGADGWRQHFEEQVEWIMSNFEFDGVYVDHWGSTRRCASARHGCGSPPFTWVTEGYHDIAKRARRAVARHTNGRGIMLLNSGGDPFCGCVSMFDLRLMGENVDLKRVPEKELTTSMNPERQGLQALIYPSRWGQDERFFTFAAAAGYPFRFRFRGKGSRLGKELWRVYQEFGAGGARKISSFAREGVIEITGRGARVNAYCREGKVLLVGGRLPATDAPRADEEKLSRDIKAAITAAGLVGYMADDINFYLRPFFKPMGAKDSPEEQGPGSGHEKMSLLDRKRLGVDEAREHVVRDLLGETEPSAIGGDWSFTFTLRTNRPFAMLVEPAD